MNLESILGAVRKQQGGVLLDANVLLLWLMHLAAPHFVGTWKKTVQFTPAHVVLLEQVVKGARRLVTTPHVLTEVTNHAIGMPTAIGSLYWAQLRRFIELARERTVQARVAAREPDFALLGLSDTAQAVLRRARPVVVTVDAPLTAALERRGLAFINLNHHIF